jgi:hypothetical protein
MRFDFTTFPHFFPLSFKSSQKFHPHQYLFKNFRDFFADNQLITRRSSLIKNAQNGLFSNILDLIGGDIRLKRINLGKKVGEFPVDFPKPLRKWGEIPDL